MTKRMWIEIIIGLTILFLIAWWAGPAPAGYRGSQYDENLAAPSCAFH